MDEDQGMTLHSGGSHAERPIDPLTDSAAHRLGLGTMVRVYVHGGFSADVSLTAIRDVTTWRDLSDRIVRAMPIEVLAPRRRVFAGGVVLHAEVLSDPVEETSTAALGTGWNVSRNERP